LEEVPPYSIDCFIDNIKLVYDNKTKKNFDSPGVDVKIKDFGQTQSVEYLDDDRLSVTSYFGPIVDNLVKKLNYKRGLNIMGAPYDWRKVKIKKTFVNVFVVFNVCFSFFSIIDGRPPMS
jgi:lysophospholipase-3